LDDLIKTFKTAAKGLTTDVDKKFMQEVWLERLIKAVEMQGGKDSKQVSVKYLF
jgi:hypothetical protein